MQQETPGSVVTRLLKKMGEKVNIDVGGSSF